MYCKNCGANINDDSAYCSKCGAPQQNECVPEKKKSVPGAMPVFILGILSLALTVAYSVPLGGLICGLICRSKVREYVEAGGALTGKAGIGKTLGQVGLILSIVSLVLGLIAAVLIAVFYSGLIVAALGFLKEMPAMFS